MRKIFDFADHILVVLDSTRVGSEKWTQVQKQNNIYGQVRSKVILIASKGASLDASDVSGKVDLPFMKSPDPVAIYQAPVLPPSSPLFRDIHHGQVQHFQQTVIGGEYGFALGHLAELAVEALNGAGRRSMPLWTSRPPWNVFGERWDKKYPKISQSWRANLSTYFKYPQEVHDYTTLSPIGR